MTIKLGLIIPSNYWTYDIILLIRHIMFSICISSLWIKKNMFTFDRTFLYVKISLAMWIVDSPWTLSTTPYILLKLYLILKHLTISIDNVRWIRPHHGHELYLDKQTTQVTIYLKRVIPLYQKSGWQIEWQNGYW